MAVIVLILEEALSSFKINKWNISCFGLRIDYRFRDRSFISIVIQSCIIIVFE